MSSPRGIVLITVDGWWDPKTRTDAIPAGFGSGSIPWADAMTPCPQVRPTVCAILTGQSPDATGVRDDTTTPLPAAVPLVSERLAKNGWRTAAFVADPRVGNGSGLEHGFEVFDAPREFLFGPARHLPRVREPGEVVSNFSTWVAGIPDGASFFAWIHLSRPLVDPPAEAAPDVIGFALERLSKLVSESVRLKRATVMLAGIAGQIDLEDGERSGYFLSPTVLRVPVLLRPREDAGREVDLRSPFTLTRIASWIAREAGVETASQGSSQETAPLVAWTWRGRREFGWPVEVAARNGSVLCIRSLPGPHDRCVSWDTSLAVDNDECRACAAALGRESQLTDSAPTDPALPEALSRKLKDLGLRAGSESVQAGPPSSLSVREGVLPGMTRARRFAVQGKAAEAAAEFQKVLAADPRNLGALIEAGEVLALDGRWKPAKARLESALRAAPWNPEVWHWLGHVSYLEKQLERAETRWQVSDVLAPHNGDVLYDLACARSLAGTSAESEAYLRRAWAAGFRNVNQIQVDPDLRNLRADPVFLRFMREVVQ